MFRERTNSGMQLLPFYLKKASLCSDSCSNKCHYQHSWRRLQAIIWFTKSKHLTDYFSHISVKACKSSSHPLSSELTEFTENHDMPCKSTQRFLLLAFELVGLPFNHTFFAHTGRETNIPLKANLKGFEDITTY